MSAFSDIRAGPPEFACVTVPDEIEYPFASYTTFRAVFRELAGPRRAEHGRVRGHPTAMPKPLYDILEASLSGAQIADASALLYEMRLSKSDAEVAMIEKAIEIADLFVYRGS